MARPGPTQRLSTAFFPAAPEAPPCDRTGQGSFASRTTGNDARERYRWQDRLERLESLFGDQRRGCARRAGDCPGLPDRARAALFVGDGDHHETADTAISPRGSPPGRQFAACPATAPCPGAHLVRQFEGRTSRAAVRPHLLPARAEHLGSLRARVEERPRRGVPAARTHIAAPRCPRTHERLRGMQPTEARAFAWHNASKEWRG